MLRLLLDTHARLWWWSDDPRLSATAHAVIADPTNDVFVSAASAWEVAIKHRLGKLNELPDAVTRFAALVEANGFSKKPIEQRHALHAASLPQAHHDPFDRMLAA